MKKFAFAMLLMTFLFAAFAGSGQAAEAAKAAAAVPKLYLNETLLKPKADPQIIEGKYTMVPIRIVSESIGYKVEWSQQAKTVTIHNGNEEIILKTGDKTALVNNRQVEMDLSAIVSKGTTLIPLRFVGEQLGLTVKWDNATKSVHLFKEEEEPERPEEPAGTEPPAAGNPGAELTAIEYDSESGIILSYDGTVVPNKPFLLDNPKRLVIDLPNTGYSPVFADEAVATGSKIVTPDEPYLQSIRYSLFSQDPATVRLVLDLAEDADADIVEGEGQLQIRVVEEGTVPEEEPEEPADSDGSDGQELPQGQTPDGDKNYTVVIDAGHGGTDPGAESILGRWEKEFNLSVSLKVKELLDQEPRIRGLLSRPEDKYVTLADRVAFAENNEADLFLSIHGNSSPKKDVTGTETYYTREDSKAFAETIQKYLVQGTGLKDRGVKTESLHVTRETTMPAVLVEAGFLSNRADSEAMYDEEVQQRIAEQLVAGIKAYLGLD